MNLHEKNELRCTVVVSAAAAAADHSIRNRVE